MLTTSHRIKCLGVLIAQHRKLGLYRNFSKNGDTIKLPEEPANCCQSGCANCVYIEYATKLTEIFQDGGDTARKIILEQVKDPTMKAFLQMELKNIELREKNESEPDNKES